MRGHNIHLFYPNDHGNDHENEISFADTVALASSGLMSTLTLIIVCLRHHSHQMVAKLKATAHRHFETYSRANKIRRGDITPLLTDTLVQRRSPTRYSVRNQDENAEAG